MGVPPKVAAPFELRPYMLARIPAKRFEITRPFVASSSDARPADQNRLHDRPASETREALEQLILAGMDVARLNFSHGNTEDHARRLATLRAVSDKCKKPVAALQDLCGPKIRAGSFPRGAYVVAPGSEITLVEGASADPEQNVIPIQYEGLAEDVRAAT